MDKYHLYFYKKELQLGSSNVLIWLLVHKPFELFNSSFYRYIWYLSVNNLISVFYDHLYITIFRVIYQWFFAKKVAFFS